MRTESSQLDRIAERIRPGESVECTEPIDAGSRRRTAVVCFCDGDPIVVQLCPDPAATRVEARLLEAIAERTSVPVPTPLGSGTVDGTGWLATARVAGDDLHESFTSVDPADRRRIARSFGRYLAELHDAFRFDAYGPLTVTDGELAADGSGSLAATVAGGVDADAVGDDPGGDRNADDDGGATTEWGAWLAAFGRAGLRCLPSEFDAVRADAAALFERADIDPAPAPRLFPWDLRPGNALLADGRIAAVLDWEGPIAAAPGLSVAKTEYLVADWYTPAEEAGSLREAFRAGYESVRAYPQVGPAHRVAAVASTAVDSRGAVTTPGYPPVSRDDAVRFHLGALQALL